MKINYNWIVVLTLSTVTGCKKFVEIDPPVTQLVTQSVFSDNASATSAQLAIFTQMGKNSEFEKMTANNGLLADEFTTINSVQLLAYRNSLTAAAGTGPWSAAYNYIYQENAILGALKGNSSLSPLVVKQLEGEALFIRAFWTFYLTNCFGAVPLVTTTQYTTNEQISRSPRSTIYQQILNDLHAAQGLLSSNFVDGSDTTVTTERVRPTVWAATALLARVYLYLDNWSGADSAASAVIGNQPMFHLDSLNGVFLKNSPEAIWDLAVPLPASSGWNPGAYFILKSAPSGNLSIALNSPLLQSFESGDRRRTSWIDSVSAGSKVYYFPYKYKVSQFNFSGTVTEYTVMLRLAEQYLIRAEALAQEGNLTAAAADLNTVRSRAGLGTVTATTQSALLSANLHERQVELFAEWGHRWFDLIRTGSADSIMGIITPFKTIGTVQWNDNDTLYPVPNSERLLDVNLSQNVGY